MNSRRRASRFFAAMLVAGGIAGIVIAITAGVQGYRQRELPVMLMFLLTIPFMWATYTGVQLWRLTSYGRKWALVIYASQIPIIKIPGILVYAWFTGLEFSPQIKFGNGDTFLNFDFNFGAIAQLNIGSDFSEYLIGCNILAVAALIFLLRSNASFSQAR